MPVIEEQIQTNGETVLTIPHHKQQQHSLHSDLKGTHIGFVDLLCMPGIRDWGIHQGKTEWEDHWGSLNTGHWGTKSLGLKPTWPAYVSLFSRFHRALAHRRPTQVPVPAGRSLLHKPAKQRECPWLTNVTLFTALLMTVKQGRARQGNKCCKIAINKVKLDC